MDPETYDVIMVRRSIYARIDCGSSTSTSWRWIRYVFEPSRNNNYWQTYEISHAYSLPIRCISNECINIEVFFHFLD